MTSSNPLHPPRFIPREELQGFAPWQPGDLGEALPAAGPGDPPVDPLALAQAQAAAHQAELAAAHQAGYADGYRDGLVALDSFKHGFSQQLSAQLGALVQAFGDEFAALEQHMAAALARTALLLARQVVRSELTTRPEQVAQAAAEAVGAVLDSASRIVVHVHPDDQALVAQGAAEVLAARGARLQADAGVGRGGCRIDTDVGRVDATLATRWAQAAQLLGGHLPWQDE